MKPETLPFDPDETDTSTVATPDPSPEVTPDASPDANAFGALLEGCRTQLINAARRLCRQDEDCVVEMVQAAVVRAFDAYMRGLFRVADNPAGWMVRILTNLFINDYHRRTRYFVRTGLEELTSGGETGPRATFAPESEQPGVALLADVLDEPLEEALNRLPEGMRSVVLLVDVQQLSYEEAAQSLRIPVGTVRSRLSRARGLLYDQLREYAVRRRIL
ncbi:MAG: RNA polymerase sigma factor [Capsulimonadales bacterium]|nr:RNA polymerase sigma factor [Capsulimonadales bacterium]